MSRDPVTGPGPHTGSAPAHRRKPLARAAAVALGASALLVSFWRIDSRFLFHPQPHDVAAWRDAARRHDAEPVALQVTDGAVLRGWLRHPAGEGRAEHAGRDERERHAGSTEHVGRGARDAADVAPVIPAAGRARLPAVLYLGGNAEEVSWLVGEGYRLPDRVLLAFNYRGYGASTGTPHERTLYADALAAYDWLAARPDVDAARITVWGRSLGSGVATWVAAQRRVEGVMLSSPFDSITALARLHQPVLAPLLTQHFDSLSRAGSIDAPVLVLIGERDTLVPPAHSERLAGAWRGPVRVVRLPRAGHGDLHDHPEYWHGIGTFLRAGGR